MAIQVSGVSMEPSEEMWRINGDPTLRQQAYEAAEAGNAEAQVTWALYLRYVQRPDDWSGAIRWLLLAAAQGNEEAHYYLGRMYYFGSRHKKDWKKAVYHYYQCANAFEQDAIEGLGDMYVEGGHGLQKDHAKSRDFYMKAITHSQDLYADHNSLYCLSLLWSEGVDVEHDIFKACVYMAWAVRECERIIAETHDRAAMTLPADSLPNEHENHFTISQDSYQKMISDYQETLSIMKNAYQTLLDQLSDEDAMRLDSVTDRYIEEFMNRTVASGSCGVIQKNMTERML
jgi:TPR repeat protein